MKKCGDCEKEKPIECFSVRNNYNKSEKIYYKTQCKECDVLRMKVWRKKNREKFNAYQNKYYHKKHETESLAISGTR